jgi:hypothetical protein
MVGDPGFVDVASGNFRVSAGSIAGSSGRDGISMGAYVSQDDVIGLLSNFTDDGGSSGGGSSEPGGGDPDVPVVPGGSSECDDWQVKHPEWIWCDSFELTDPLSDRYEDVNMLGLSRVTGEAANGSASLQLTYDEGQVEAGWLIKVEDAGYPERVFYRWYHKFKGNYTSFPPKMARIGYRDRSTWDRIFSINSWVSGSNPVLDVYAQNSSQGPWLPVATSSYDLIGSLGEWVCFEVEVKLNAQGVADGFYRMWINDELSVERLNVDLRGSASHKINEIMLDGYWNGGAPAALSRYYDNFVISTSKIGMLDIAPQATSPALSPGGFSGVVLPK